MRKGISNQLMFEMTAERMKHGLAQIGLSDIKITVNKTSKTATAYSNDNDVDISLTVSQEEFALDITDMSTTFHEQCTLGKIQNILKSIKNG